MSTIDTVARTLYGEARGTGLLDRLGVLAVIRERVLRPGWWGSGWEDVCRHPWQFSCWHTHDQAHRRNHAAMMSAHETDSRRWREVLLLAQYAVNGMTDADVMRLFGVQSVDMIPTHYHDRSIDTPKAWGEDIVEVAPAWPSAFRWYVVLDGRPKRRP